MLARCAICAWGAAAVLGRMPDGLIHNKWHAKIVTPVHERADLRRLIWCNLCHGEPRVIQSGPCSVFRPGAAMDR